MSRKLDEGFIIDAYVNQGKSTVWIAEQLGTTAKTVRAVILRSGYALRSKKEAAENSYKNGREHPQQGKPLSEETKKKIGKSISKNWAELSDENYQKRVEKARETWYNLDVLVREKISSLARSALAISSKDGSKLERAVMAHLLGLKLSPIHHYKNFPYEKLEVDIFLPANKIAVEIDGPTHFLPIFGEDRLQETIKSDQKKNNLLLGLGYVVIRIGFTKEVSQYQQEDMLKELEELIEEINLDFPKDGYRYFELEIK